VACSPLGLACGDGSSADLPHTDAIEVEEELTQEPLVPFAELQSTDRVTLIDGPLPCLSADASEVDCGLFKARIEPLDANDGPPGDPLDARTGALPIWLAVRAPLGAALSETRWIVLDSGGPGAGYAPFFGRLPPGQYEAGGAGYGDDLIRAHNDAGFVTVDISYECNEDTGRPCAGWEYAGHAPHYELGTGWVLDAHGTGFDGASRRSNAIYQWILANNGGEKICGHSHSSGSGRMLTAITRLGAQDLFEAVVFDGGPTWGYMPWICGVDEGPLGTRPPWHGAGAGDGQRLLVDCGYEPGPNSAQCSVTSCADMVYDAPHYLRDSALLQAQVYDLPDLNMGIVLGGADNTNAWRQMRFWFTGAFLDSHGIPPLTARNIELRQGYCASAQDDFPHGETDDITCAHWTAENFPGIQGTGLGFVEAIVETGHSTTESLGGMETTRDLMNALCAPL